MWPISQPHSIGGSSDVASRCQYCSNLLCLWTSISELLFDAPKAVEIVLQCRVARHRSRHVSKSGAPCTQARTVCLAVGRQVAPRPLYATIMMLAVIRTPASRQLLFSWQTFTLKLATHPTPLPHSFTFSSYIHKTEELRSYNFASLPAALTGKVIRSVVSVRSFVSTLSFKATDLWHSRSRLKVNATTPVVSTTMSTDWWLW